MLTDLKVRTAEPRERDYKISDSGGLYLYITTKGYRSWRMKYRFGGKEKRLTFGPYPEVPLSEARERRDTARRLLRDHRDPAVEELKRKLAAAVDHAETFETVARRWHAVHQARWAPVHVEALAAIRPLTGRYKLIFPSERHAHRPMSENAIGYLYNRNGYHGRHVPHGWRAAFSTIMNERAERIGRAGDRAIIDLMLAHVPANSVEGAYNRAAYMDRRREIAQEWGDALMDGLAPAGQLLVGPRRE